MSDCQRHGIKHSDSQGLIDAAYRFALKYHGEQKRKYTGEPYINHPVEVANIVSSVTDDCEMISAALLHDVIEDTVAEREDLMNFGFMQPIADLVAELTDISTPSDGNRAKRKEIDRLHLANASDRAKTIKLADLISNSKSICEHDKKFAKVYMKEKSNLLNVLVGGDESLMLIATEIVSKWESQNHNNTTNT